jgi:hypothetical protein
MVSVRGANRDPAFRNHNTVSDHEFDILVRRVYKVATSATSIHPATARPGSKWRDVASWPWHFTATRANRKGLADLWPPSPKHGETLER